VASDQKTGKKAEATAADEYLAACQLAGKIGIELEDG